MTNDNSTDDEDTVYASHMRLDDKAAEQLQEKYGSGIVMSLGEAMICKSPTAPFDIVFTEEGRLFAEAAYNEFDDAMKNIVSKIYDYARDYLLRAETLADKVRISTILRDRVGRMRAGEDIPAGQVMADLGVDFSQISLAVIFPPGMQPPVGKTPLEVEGCRAFVIMGTADQLIDPVGEDDFESGRTYILIDACTFEDKADQHHVLAGKMDCWPRAENESVRKVLEYKRDMMALATKTEPDQILNKKTGEFSTIQ
jgi:hypothetical protein